VVLGTGAGTFQNRIFSPPFSTNVGGGYLRAADFDLDGKMDVVVAGISELKVLFGNGDGTFGTGDGAFGGTVTLPTAPGSVEIADFNGDGIPDIAVMHAIGWTVGILFGRGDRTFSAPVEYPLGTFACATYYPSGPCGGYETFLAIGDLNGDGVPDVVTVQPVVGESSRVVIVLVGNPDGSLHAPVSYPLTTLSVYQPNDSFVLEDLDGDGHLDLVVLPGYGSMVGVLRGNGDGSFAAATRFYTVIGNNGAGHGVAVVDVSGDGKLDVISSLRVVQGTPAAEVGLSLGIGDGTLQIANLEVTSRPDLRSVILGDFNGDGMVDFAELNPDDGEAMIFLGALPPLLQIAKTHAGNFTQGQIGAQFTITVSNVGGSPTAGTVTVTDWPGGNVPITSMSGSGWICVGTSCSRNDALPVSASYPPITALANITTLNGETFPAAINEVFVSGGGALSSASAIDTAQIGQPPSCTYSLGATSDSRSGSAGFGSVSITSPSGCAWTASVNGGAPWISITAATGSGNGIVNYSVTANTTGGSRSGVMTIAEQSFNVSQAPQNSNPGVFRSGFYWLQDVDGNQQFNTPPDAAFAFGGVPGDIPITGDWNGNGHTKVGVYRPANGLFILDYDGDGQFTAADKVYNLGVGVQAGDVPVVGDWNGNGKTKVGLFRQGFFWILDTNGNGVFEQGVDNTYAFGGVAGDVPVVGDWNGTRTSKIGLFRLGFYWILDANGNGSLDNINGAGGDQAFAYGGIAGDVPVVGDWNGNGTSKVGVFRQGFFWVLDANGNHTFDGTGPGQDLAFPFGGISGDVPVMGKW
jgi:FG-GAP-like repeat